jgi:hypothetical protein
MTLEINTDICIAGGGVGGIAATLAATSLGFKVVLVEETDWLGGQLTSQVTPPDEHPWIESFGCTASYRRLRNLIRRYYYDNFSLSPSAKDNRFLNPGNGSVSGLCCEPRAALTSINQMLAPAFSKGLLQVILKTKAIECFKNKEKITALRFKDFCKDKEIIVNADFFIDATELGDVLPLAGVDYVVGSESEKMTSEPDAKSKDYDPENVQGFTFCFAMEYDQKGNHLIDEPASYKKWKKFKPDLSPHWPGKLFSWEYTNPFTLEPVTRQLFSSDSEEPDFWRYRRIIDKRNFAEDINEVTIVNWPQNDYFSKNIIDKSEDEKEKILNEARNLSLSFFYWLQTEAPRQDSGYGYPELKLRPDVTGTSDGLAKFPYIRESRRIAARFTVTENDIAAYLRKKNQSAAKFDDTVGIGCYRIDLHPTSGNDNYFDMGSYPFQIPIGYLIPEQQINLLPACKNIGTTHITNGCYRLHPVEWNIGEAAGSLAAYCLRENLTAVAVYEDKNKLNEYQNILVSRGIELDWPQLGIV